MAGSDVALHVFMDLKLPLKVKTQWLLLPAFLILTGCPPQKSSEQSSRDRKVIFLKGDPMELVEGTKMNPTSPITEKNIEEWNHYSIFSQFALSEKEKVSAKPRTKKEIEAQNKTTDKTKQPHDSSMYRVEVRKDDSGKFQLYTLKGQLIFKLEMGLDGRLQPKTAIVDNKSYDINVLHWSESADGKYLSLLLSMDYLNYGHSLIAIYFSKGNFTSKEIRKTDEAYSYIAGPGNLIGWDLREDEKLEVSICGAQSIEEEIKIAFSKWQKALERRLNIELTFPKEYAPISDLNQHCIYVMDTYLREYQEDEMNNGITLGILSLDEARFIDSDVIIFNGELNKYVKLYEQVGRREEGLRRKDSSLRFTIIHELGHLLGLDHIFDGTSSVMSYSFEDFDPTSYDIKALHLLYPLK